MVIPCDYFVKRGFAPTTLNHFDVGLCVTEGSAAYMRATVPVYDDAGKYMIGYTARSINEKCPLCEAHHYYKHPCPRDKIEESFSKKWRHSDGFNAASTLYNIWNLKSDTAVLVEGTGDVWRLYEAGCQNGLGLFGCSISYHQIAKLAEAGVQNIILLLDNDEAGQQAAVKIQNRIRLYFNSQILHTSNKDVGDTPPEEINKLLKSAKWKALGD